MFGFGFGELLVILVILMVIFGVPRLGDFGGEFGKAIRNFRKAVSEPDAIDVTPKDDDEKDEDEKKSDRK